MLPPITFSSIPLFWQGVSTSVAASIIVGGGVWFYRAQAAAGRRSAELYARRVATVRAKLASTDPIVRVEGYLIGLFALAEVLIAALLVLVAGELVGLIVGFPAVVFYAVGFVILLSGMKWTRNINARK